MRDKEQFTRLVNLHKGSVFRLAYGYLRSKADADDVVQEVFLKLYRYDGAFESDDHAKNWLLRVTVNECTALWRLLHRRPENIDDYLETLSVPEPQDAGLVRRVMELPTRYRTVLYLHYFEGYATSDIAGVLGVPAATVRTRLARGRARLKDVLIEEGAR